MAAQVSKHGDRRYDRHGSRHRIDWPSHRRASPIVQVLALLSNRRLGAAREILERRLARIKKRRRRRAISAFAFSTPAKRIWWKRCLKARGSSRSAHGNFGATP
jgi:hypothetical protein